MVTISRENRSLRLLLAKLDKTTGDGSCWPYMGSRWNGYGHVTRSGRNWKAHRLAYTLMIGPIPDSLDVLHHCDNPPCCNPAHLFLGTHADNMMDRSQKGRGNQPQGEHHSEAKLSNDQVREMLAFFRRGLATQKELARVYHIVPQAIWSIVHRKAWKHL